ncbi:MAG: hypothetical protein HN742_42220 [Lentisphaerae bacterium]|jgi:neutral ceramidase|nr:hypothetical protein [Lentisphaerota bacterium]MBT4820330.1 hypothetical protein [Lentisphaerota bacterium]MBT5605921.1 hypothetical protein [Lentisphaerota bacterium]MBT7058000.1 hypothetical protein [Lentisphaerota bacterium]MBT7848555.1 hypothetical protein [Lentisphaerota bacterium]
MSQEQMGWQAGFGSVDFTPPPNLPMMGNFRADYAATGTHDPLTARALVLQSRMDQAPVALLSLDLCMMPRSCVALMRRWIRERTGIPAGNVLIAATHTHSGPATLALYGMPKAEDSDIEAFLETAVGAVSSAVDRIRPAALKLGRGTEDRVSFNRRLLDASGQTHMNWEDLSEAEIARVLGPVDTEILALQVEHEDGSGGVVVNFALHPAVLDYANRLYSADYPGYLAEALKTLNGPRFEPLFFNGCCGNVNHIDYTDPDAPRRGYQATQRIGFMLAAATHSTLKHGATPLNAGPVRPLSEHVALARHPITDAQIEWARQVLERDDSPFVDAADGFPEEARAETWLEMHAAQHQADSVEVMAIRIGDMAIVGLPGEVFCEFGLDIKAKSPAAHTMVFELANDAIGYLPTREAFPQGGYEVVPGSTRYAPDAGEKLAQAAHRLLSDLFSTSTSPCPPSADG